MRGSVSRFEHALGSGERARRVVSSPVVAAALAGPSGGAGAGAGAGWTPAPALVGYGHTQVGFSAWLEPPRPVVTLTIDLEGAITADGAALPSAWIGGMGERPTVVGVGERYGAIDVKLAPLAAFTLLGGGLHVVVRVLALLRASSGAVRVAALAAQLGVSRRHLTRRFTAQVGLAPKAVARQLRFAEVRRCVEASQGVVSGPADPGSGAGLAAGSWAGLAAAVGYADQAHLTREFRDLAGVTPTDFVARRMPEGGLVGDGLCRRRRVAGGGG